MDHLWIESSASSAPIGARVLRASLEEEGRIVVVDDDGNVHFPVLSSHGRSYAVLFIKEHRLGVEARIRLMHPTSVQGVEDLLTLSDLHEAGILRNFHTRYKQNLIYVSSTAEYRRRF